MHRASFSEGLAVTGDHLLHRVAVVLIGTAMVALPFLKAVGGSRDRAIIFSLILLAAYSAARSNVGVIRVPASAHRAGSCSGEPGPLGSLFAPVVLILILGLASVIWTVSPEETFRKGSLLLFQVLLFTVTAKAINRTALTPLLIAASLAAAASAAYGLYQVVTGGSLVELTSTFEYANSYAQYLLIFIVLGVILAQFRRKWLLGPCGVAAAAYFLTFSRGSFLLIPLVVVVAIVALEPFRRKTFILYLGITLALGLTIAWGVVSFLPQAAPGGSAAEGLLTLEMGPETSAGRGMLSRFSFWEAAAEMFIARPVTGYGLGTFGTVYPSFQEDVAYFSVEAHNHYIQTAAELGILGLLALAWFLAVLWRRARRGAVLEGQDRALWAGVAAGLVGFLAHSAIDADWEVPAAGIVFWFLAGLLANLTSRAEPEVTGGDAFTATHPSDSAVGSEKGRFPVQFLHGRLMLLLAALPVSLIRGALLFLLFIGSFLAVAPYAADVRLTEGIVHFGSGAMEEARAKFQATLRLNPLSTAAVVYIGESSRRLKSASGRSEYLVEARNVLTAGVSREPFNAALQSTLGLVLDELGLPEEAGRAHFKSVEIFPVHPLYRYRYGLHLFRVGDLRGAATQLSYLSAHEAELRLVMNSRGLSSLMVDTNLALARVRAGLGQLEEARRILRRVLEFDPDNRVAAEGLQALVGK